MPSADLTRRFEIDSQGNGGTTFVCSGFEGRTIVGMTMTRFHDLSHFNNRHVGCFQNVYGGARCGSKIINSFTFIHAYQG